MRLRNVKGSREVIAEDPHVVHEPEKLKGHWKDFYGNRNPIHIEIGMGKGRFIRELAKLNPQINYIGIEKYSSVLIRALEKINQEDLKNLVFIRMDAEEINQVFSKNEVDRIYLNFSDPWPKEKHAKRRLTSRQFLERYHQFLSVDGKVKFKTDNHDLFIFSLEELEASGWTLSSCSYDLHHSEYADGNIMTEYEEKFSGEGKPIHFFTADR